jgi:hypothetical protein
MKQARDPRIVILVEGLSDQRAIEALAARRGRDLDAEGGAVVSIGGSKNIGRFLDHYGPRGLEIGLAGLRRGGGTRLPKWSVAERFRS